MDTYPSLTNMQTFDITTGSLIETKASVMVFFNLVCLSRVVYTIQLDGIDKCDESWKKCHKISREFYYLSLITIGKLIIYQNIYTRIDIPTNNI